MINPNHNLRDWVLEYPNRTAEFYGISHMLPFFSSDILILYSIIIKRYFAPAENVGDNLNDEHNYHNTLCPFADRLSI